MIHLGTSIYFWGEQEQNRLLVDCLHPLAMKLKQAGLTRRFWFDRFDARGPHIFALLSCSPRHLQETSDRTVDALTDFLSAHGSTVELSVEEIEEYHAGCRGKIQCEADSYPGLAKNNTFFLFEHPGDGYPFWLLARVPAENELWELLDGWAFWALDRIAAASGNVPMGPALHWMASLDRALRASGEAPAEFWRYHATTLILPLRKRLETEEREVIRSLPNSIGVKNRATFDQIWKRAETLRVPPDLRALVEIAVPREAATERLRWGVLREVVHAVLKQLSIPVNSHIPPILYAWNRNLRVNEPAVEVSEP